MTTLIGYQGDGWAVIGSDSRATDQAGNYMELSLPKIIKNGRYLIAVAGSSRGGNIVQFGWKTPTPPSTNDTLVLDKFITNKFIPSMRRAFIRAGFDMKDDGDYARTESVFLIAVNGIIYWINDDYSWDRDARGIYHQGSGGPLAAAALTALDVRECTEPEQVSILVKRAVEVATQWDVFSYKPVYVAVQHFGE